MLSYWEQQSFIRYDHIVIGSGIVGLSVAIELKERSPDANVLVLERGLLPSGASSRNAGFACMGSLTELLDDRSSMTDEEIVGLFELRKKGLERLRRRLGDNNIGYVTNGSYELISDSETDALDKMEEINQLLSSILKQPAFKRADEKLDSFGFSKQHTKALVENTCEGALDTGRMMRALMNYALQKKVEIKTGADVLYLNETPQYVSVHIDDPARHEELVLRAGTVSICTNAFASQLLPEVDVIPGRGQILMTQPIEGLKFKGIFHFNKGYYYFREVDGRILIGGGRNLDVNGETTTELDLSELIQIELESKLHNIIIPDTHFLIEQRWSGIMAFGTNKQPIVKAFSDRIYGAFRMGGMGIAIGSEVAKRLVGINRG